MSNTGISWFGGKEARERAEAVMKRRNAASALVTDLDAELADIRVSVELDQPTYQDSDQESLKKSLGQAQRLLDEIYADINLMMNQQIGERINELEAFQLTQPALGIEAKATELRRWIERTRELKVKLDKPKTEVNGSLSAADRKRLAAEADLTLARQVVAQIKEARGENYPQVSAALLTVEREVATANQLYTAAQQAVMRQAYREGLDLSQRTQSLYDSASGKLSMIKVAGRDFEKAAGDADDVLQKALKMLQNAKAELTDRAAILNADPNTYFQAAVHRIGEARRAIKANPPQAITCYRLSSEAISLIEDALQRARDEVRRLRDGRINSRNLLQRLQEAVTNTRLVINEKQAVPVKAKELYTQARDERDRLMQYNIDTLSPQELEKFISSATLAIKLAETALGLL